MLVSRIIYLSLLISSYSYAAISLSDERLASENCQQSIITRTSVKGITAPSVVVLETMRAAGGLLLDSSEDELNSRKAAADEAFWAHYCNVKLHQEALPRSDDRVLFPNLLELIRDSGIPVVERFSMDDEENMLNNAFLKFCIACELLFLGATELDEDNELVKNIVYVSFTAESAKCKSWFVKVLQSKDGDVPQGRSILIGRLAQLADFLNGIATSYDLESRDRVKAMLENNAITNADDCPDRAISGLDDIDFDVGLFHTPTIEQAVHLLLRKYKKHIIQESLVEHRFHESAQEYVYLLLLLKDHFNLGVCSAGILSGEIGARKTFDVAARMLMDNISIEGLCYFIGKDVSFRNFLRGISAHQAIMDEMACDPDGAEDALYTYARGIIEPYVNATFVVDGKKFQELKSKDIAILEGLIASEAA